MLENNKLRQKAENLADSIIHLRRKCDAVESAAFAKLTRSQQNVLMLIGEKSCCTMTEMAKELNASLSTLTSIMDKLVRLDYVERKRCTQDRRNVKVQLTQEGIELYKLGFQGIVQIVEYILKPLSDTEQDQMLSFYQRAEKQN